MEEEQQNRWKERSRDRKYLEEKLKMVKQPQRREKRHTNTFRDEKTLQKMKRAQGRQKTTYFGVF